MNDLARTSFDTFQPASFIRDITGSEVELFHRNGWVYLPNLIEPVLAAELFRRARILMGEDLEKTTGGGGGDPAFAHYGDILRNFLGAWKADMVMRSVSHAPALGKIASRLLHDKPVRFLNDEILAKRPVSQNGKPTPWHQDFPHAAFDRTSMVNIWIALIDLPPELGAMRFLDGSHRAGPLGRTLLDEKDVIEQNPWLPESYPISQPIFMRAGDATVHGDLTVHCGPANTSDKIRWAYLVNLFDAGAKHSGGPTYGEPIESVETNQQYTTDRYPVTFPGAVIS